MLRIRLQRKGRKKRPIYHVVVADSRSPRDGRIVEDLGRFYNLSTLNQLELDKDRAIHWLKKGAQPSDTVRSILKKQGLMYKMHLIRWGKSEEEIEAAMEEWREQRADKGEEQEEGTKKEKRRALLEAEEKEYQKQLQKKAEEAAKEKAKQEALASDEDEDEETTAEAAEEVDEAQVPEEKAAEAAEEVADEADDVAEEDDTEEVEAEAEKEEAETEAKSDAEADEEQKTAEAEVEEDTEEDAEEEVTAEAESEEEPEEKDENEAKVSTDLLAQEAIDHIENTPLEELEGFVTEDEDRVTVQRAWETKQEEG